MRQKVEDDNLNEIEERNKEKGGDIKRRKDGFFVESFKREI